MSGRPLQLMLIDEDPTFRLGLRVWLEQLPGFQVAAEAGNAETALALLQSRSQALEGAFDNPRLRSQALQPIDLVILDMGLGQSDPQAMAGLDLCQAIKTAFPALPVLVLSAQAEPVLEAAARQVGADGYGTRGMPVRALAQLVRQVAQRTSAQRTSSEWVRPAPAMSAQIPGPLTAMRLSMRLAGLQQIDAALADLQTLREQGRLAWLDQLVLDGRTRELKAARWLMNRLWATPQFIDADWAAAPPRQTVSPRLSESGPLAAVGTSALRSQPGDLPAQVFEAVFSKLQTPLANVSPVPLEIDILRSDKKRELLYIILRQLEELLSDLQQSNLQPGQLREKASAVLSDLWQATLEEFFGKYYTVRVNAVEQEVVTVLQQERHIVRAEMLSRIPFVPALLGHWLFEEPLYIDGSPYLATTPEAMRQSERLLENLLIQMANAVMQPLLNRLADVEAIKKSLYSRQLMSTRDIERFRNDLAWRYRWDQWVNEPKAIFESQYRLLTFTPRGIDLTSVYAPRRDELEQLSGLQWAVTVALETRDALAPRLRRAISFVGSGVVYVLTEVVGRGIGLIGRGILQGVGSAWQDTRRSRQRKRPEFNEWE
ncbi:MAG: DUF3685 domain-containing protein [Leptolyngbya sp. SIO4C1]|nr:DUF3685 domain-containing protein [Leptolyngbya sp. SIO4C1]